MTLCELRQELDDRALRMHWNFAACLEYVPTFRAAVVEQLKPLIHVLHIKKPTDETFPWLAGRLGGHYTRLFVYERDITRIAGRDTNLYAGEIWVLPAEFLPVAVHARLLFS